MAPSGASRTPATASSAAPPVSSRSPSSAGSRSSTAAAPPTHSREDPRSARRVDALHDVVGVLVFQRHGAYTPRPLRVTPTRPGRSPPAAARSQPAAGRSPSAAPPPAVPGSPAVPGAGHPSAGRQHPPPRARQPGPPRSTADTVQSGSRITPGVSRSAARFPATYLSSVLCVRPLSCRQERRWCQSAGS